jgi:hypothetical protein
MSTAWHAGFAYPGDALDGTAQVAARGFQSHGAGRVKAISFNRGLKA